MPNRGKHQAAGKGISHRNPVLFRGTTQDITLDLWRAQRIMAVVHEVDILAGLVTDMVPTHKRNRGLEEFNLLQQSSTLVDFRQAFAQLPNDLRPARTITNKEAIRLALILAGRPSVARKQ